MNDLGRTNVALTRAQEVLWIIGGEMKIGGDRREPPLITKYKREMVAKGMVHNFSGVSDGVGESGADANGVGENGERGGGSSGNQSDQNGGSERGAHPGHGRPNGRAGGYGGGRAPGRGGYGRGRGLGRFGYGGRGS